MYVVWRELRRCRRDDGERKVALLNGDTPRSTAGRSQKAREAREAIAVTSKSGSKGGVKNFRLSPICLLLYPVVLLDRTEAEPLESLEGVCP